MKKKGLISFVIPAYNESKNIHTLIQEIESNLSLHKLNYEILIIDDHSSDHTFEAVKKLRQPKVNCIRLSRRSGSHIAVRAGLQLAIGEAVICMSADGQDNPKAIPQLIKKFKEGYQTVWAIRKKRREPLRIKLLALLFYKLCFFLNNTRSEFDLANADFYLLSRRVVDTINQCKENKTSLFALIVWWGFKQTAISYERRDRQSGQSKWNMRSRLKLAADWIISFSGLPLRFTLFLGLLFSILGFGFAGTIIYNVIYGKPVEGWSSLMVAVLVLGGLQLIFLGIVGEYLWKNLEESKKRPFFSIEDQVR